MSDRSTLVLAACAAIGASLACGPSPLLGVTVLLLALISRRPWFLCVGVAVLAGGLGARAHDGLHPPPLGPYTGTVTLLSDPESFGDAVRVEVRARGKHLEAWADDPAAARLRDRLAGERIAIEGAIERSPPGAVWLEARHIVGRLSINSVADWSEGAPVARLANGLRRTLARGAAVLPDEQRSLFLGFVLGDDRDQPPEVADDFRGAGLTHLLAVSGQNVAFVLALAGPLLRRLTFRGRLPTTIAVIAFFALVTRFEPSVLRASVMAGIAAVAAAMGREASGLRCLALAVTGLILVDPLLVRSVGFQLSAAASAGILLLSRPLAARLPGPRPIIEALAVTVSAQLAVAPILAVTFGGIPLASVPANLLAAPAAGPVMAWGLAGGLVAGWFAGLGGGAVTSVLHVPTMALIGWLAFVARWAARLPLGELGVREVVLAVVAAAAAVVAARHGRSAVVAATATLAGVALLAPAVALRAAPPLLARPADGAELWRAGGAAVLVLGDRVRAADLLQGLRRAGVGRLDLVVVRGVDDRTVESAEAVGRRHPISMFIAPRPARLQGARTIEEATTIGIGELVVAINPRAGVLQVVVQRARAPPCMVPLVELALGDTRYDITTRTVVMGILNRTPDSFFDQGSYFDFDAFVARADQLVHDGADFLDVGGVKAGPGPEVGEQEELDRVVPAIEALHARFDVPLSVDTWRASVAKAAFDAGACVGNDISGFADPDYLPVCAAAGASVVATHIRLKPRVPDPEPVYDEPVVDAVCRFLADRGLQAEAAGIPRERVMVDAGLDLGKTEEQSLELLRRSDRLVELGYPVFLSASNKRFIGHLLGTDVADRREGTLAAHALGVVLGCRILRAHDVRGARRVADVVAAILEAA